MFCLLAPVHEGPIHTCAAQPVRWPLWGHEQNVRYGNFQPTDTLAGVRSTACASASAPLLEISLWLTGRPPSPIAGGVGVRLANRLATSGFRDRFIEKGRFERRMDEMPVKLITYPQPGLLSAAAAFAHQHLSAAD
jgi:hypothetical protein